MNLTGEQGEFLECVRDGGSLKLAERKDDPVRQFCQRKGVTSVLVNPRRWVITTRGRDALGKERGNGG